MLVDSFETVVYAIAFLLLVAAAVLVVIGGGQAVVQAATHQVNEPFLFIGLIACVRRILIVTAATEQVHTDKELNRLLLELGALGLLVIGITVAIFLVRFSARHATPTGDGDG